MKIFKEFEGKTAFVTGAASGMGQAAAICFGGIGCRVAVAAGKGRMAYRAGAARRPGAPR